MENASNSSSTRGGTDSGLVTEQVRQGTQQVVQSTQQAVNQATEGARQQAQTVLERQKSQSTQTLHQVHTALSQAGQNLRDQNQTAAAGLVEGAAGKLDTVCQYLEGHDIGQLLGDAEDFARDNAPVFLGGAFALGVLAARFLKSSTPPRPAYTSGYSSGGNYSGYPSGRSYDNYPAGRSTIGSTYEDSIDYRPMSDVVGGTPPEPEQFYAGTGTSASTFTEVEPEPVAEVSDEPAI